MKYKLGDIVLCKSCIGMFFKHPIKIKIVRIERESPTIFVGKNVEPFEFIEHNEYFSKPVDLNYNYNDIIPKTILDIMREKVCS